MKTKEELPEFWRLYIETSYPGGKLEFAHAKEIRIEFEFGSLYFDEGFIAVMPSRDELAVFTEHEGYHVFPLGSVVNHSNPHFISRPPRDHQDE